ncbi:MAG: phosphodiester glycosidase family protein [Defluviitaleaceae bacterium]|nr:phosphodiester glycosidase family protein [Defluviitaleaceae bacterium]
MKYLKFLKHLKFAMFLIFALGFIAFFATSAEAVDIFFEHRVSEEISRGVIYEQNRLMTSRGMLDVHVLLVDVSAPFISIAPVPSSNELGLREPTSRLLTNAGAIAGINADFFDMTRRHSTYFGPMVRDGEVLALRRGGGYSATFFLDARNNPFFRYMTTQMSIYSNGVFLTNIAAYNSIGANITSPVIVSRAAVYDTADIDARVAYTLKVVVQNGVVTEATFSTVETPENGFVIIVPHASLPYYERFLTQGARVDFNISTDLNVDFSNISSAIGGGAVILRNGVITEPAGVQPNARHPRTAVGALRDGRIILMVVDGRSHSIGVTHTELGAILRHYGAVDAMHMDGGGSTTMAAQRPGENLAVLNTLSDGSQRSVTNALGVFDNSPLGELAGIRMIPAENRAVQLVPLQVNVFGVDRWGNRLEIDRNRVEFHISPELGFWNAGVFTPLRTGRIRLFASYGEFRAYTDLDVFSLAELQPHTDKINLLIGGQAALRFSGIAIDGSHINIPEVTSLRVSPEYLGVFENGSFVARNGGVGYIQAAIGSITAYIPVSVGGFPWPIDMFGGTYLSFLSVPQEFVSTEVSVRNADGRNIIALNYSIGRTAATQASYVTFYPALELPGDPVAVRMDFYGDNSGHWLRARVRDADGEFHNITFARHVDFSGWQTVTAPLPNAPAPFTLDRLYLAELESFEETSHSVLFYNLRVLFTPNHNIPVPRGTVFQDRLRTDSPPQGATLHEFAIPEETVFSVSASYAFAVAHVTAYGGSIRAANSYQWRDLLPNIRRLNSPYVVILLDTNNFGNRAERDLFHLAMTELHNDGRLVFVITPGDEPALTMRDNIRYIRVTDGVIRFWTQDNRVWWSN